MIKIYNQNRLLVFQTMNYTNPFLEIDATAFDMLTIVVPADTPVHEEDYIEIKEGRFVVKEKNYSDGEFELVCLADVDDLEQKQLANFVHATVTMQTMLDDFLVGTGWTGTCSSTMKRTVTGTNLNALQAVLKAASTFRFEIRFNTATKTIVVAERLGQDIGAYFDDELNLEKLEYQSDSYGYATRIVPTGQAGIGIESINDGLAYLENKTYYQKTKTHFLSDERYTILENLKYDAQIMLDDMATPLRSYAVKLIDLVKDRPELQADVFDTICLKHRDSQTKVKQRLVKKKIRLDRPWDVDVVIANKMRDLLTETDRAISEVRRSYESITARFDLFEDAIEGEVSSLRLDVDEHGTTIEGHTAKLSLIDDEISAKVENEVSTKLSDPAVQEQFKGDPGTPGEDGQDGQDADIWSIGTDYYWYKNGVKTTYKAVGADGAQGLPGIPGEDGRGISSVSEEFYLSTSSTSVSGGSWSINQPNWTTDRFLWKRFKIVYTNPTETIYTASILDVAWGKLAQVVTDGVISVLEKADLAIKMEELASEKIVVVDGEPVKSLAGIESEKTAYTDAYNALVAYVNPILTNMTATTTINGAEYQAKFNDYFAARDALITKAEQLVVIQMMSLVQRITSAETRITDEAVTDIIKQSEVWAKIANAETGLSTVASDLSTFTTETYAEFKNLVTGFMNTITETVTRNGSDIESVTKYFGWVNGVIKLGDSLNDMYMQLEKTKLAFMDGQTELGYFSAAGLRTDAVDTDKIIMGKHFWDSTTPDHLTLIYEG